MLRALTTTAASALVLALLAMPATASDLNSQLSDQQIADFCATAGLGEHKASLTIGDQQVVGTVECEQEHSASATPGSDDSVDTPDSSDDSVDTPETEDESADDNGHDSSDDEGDDNSGEGSHDSGHDGGHDGEGSDD